MTNSNKDKPQKRYKKVVDTKENDPPTIPDDLLKEIHNLLYALDYHQKEHGDFRGYIKPTVDKLKPLLKELNKYL